MLLCAKPACSPQINVLSPTVSVQSFALGITPVVLRCPSRLCARGLEGHTLLAGAERSGHGNVRAPELIAGSGTYLDRSARCTWRFVCHHLCRDGHSGRVRVCCSPAFESSPHLHRMQNSHSSSASSPSSRPLTTKEIEHQEQSSTEGNTALSALFPGDGRREETLCPQ